MAKKKHKRKGIAVGELTSIALLFILIGVTLGIGAYINSQLQASYPLTSTSVTQESIAFAVNDTYYPLTMYNNGEDVVIDAVYNTTNKIGSGQSATDGTGKVKIYTNATFTVGTLSVNYTYNRYGSDYLITRNSTSGIGNISGWLPIIGIVIAAGVVITVLLRSFSMRRDAAGI